MYRPVLVEAPSILPVTVEEVKQSLRIDTADDDAVIERDIRAAVAHYEGWTGILGIVLVEQTWRQEFDSFDCLHLPLGPVIAVSSVKWRNKEGQIATIDQADYALRTDGAGRSFVQFRHGYHHPPDLYESAAVQVEYRAGWANTDDTPPKPTVPDDIRVAMIMRVQLGYDEAAKANSANLERAEDALISKYRRFSL
jgi:phage conserved hypothetical protein, phiE125 gp8 family